MQKNIGIIIGRFNPLHIGHISLINSSISKCDKTIIILGSANKVDKLNPFSVNERLFILEKEFGNNLILDYLNDYDNDIDWINNLKLILNKYTNFENNITFFGGDLQNDYAINIIKKFINNLNFNKIDFLEKHRNEIPISATKIRNHLDVNENIEAEKWLSENTKHIIIKKYVV